MPQATLFFAGFLSLLYVFLTLQVIRARWRYRVPYGATQEHPDLMRAVRAHGNFAEYVPLFLILLYLEEIYVGSVWASWLIGALFFAGRLSHAHSMLAHEGKGFASGASVGYTLRFRFYAMTHTFIPLAILALMLLVQFGLNLRAGL